MLPVRKHGFRIEMMTSLQLATWSHRASASKALLEQEVVRLERKLQHAKAGDWAWWPTETRSTHRKTTMKFRICSHCKKRTPHHDQAGVLCCSQCVHTPRQPTRNSGSDGATGLRAALKLWVTYPHPANCFLVYALQACLKTCLFFWLLFGVFERGFFTSALMFIVGVFAVNCFGPRGREKTVAVAFGKQFWTTLVPR